MHLAAKMPETARFAEKHAREKKNNTFGIHRKMPIAPENDERNNGKRPRPPSRDILHSPQEPPRTPKRTSAGNRANGQTGKRANGQTGKRATGQPDNRTTGQSGSRAVGQSGSQALRQTGKQAVGQSGSRAVGHDTRTSGRHGGRKENRNVRKKAGARTFRTKENAALAKPRMGFSNGCFSFAVADHQVPAISL